MKQRKSQLRILTKKNNLIGEDRKIHVTFLGIMSYNDRRKLVLASILFVSVMNLMFQIPETLSQWIIFVLRNIASIMALISAYAIYRNYV